MVLVIIKFTIATNRLSNKRGKNMRESKPKKFVDNNKICSNDQISYVKKNLNT